LQILGQADQLLDALTDDGVVFGYQYTDHLHSPRLLFLRAKDRSLRQLLH
jgi:hypothetical protein